MNLNNPSPVRWACSSILFVVVSLFFAGVFFYQGVVGKPLAQNHGYQSPIGYTAPHSDSITLGVEEQKRVAGFEPNDPFSGGDEKPLPGRPDRGFTHDTLKKMLDALEVMQSAYFAVWKGTWPSGNDWTRAVLGTHVSATLSAVSRTLDDILDDCKVNDGCDTVTNSRPSDALAFENLISYYFQQTSAFWFGENYVGLRLQAYDDMLWVVLEWLENIRFQDLHSDLHYRSHPRDKKGFHNIWHGKQYQSPAAHRARVFYDLASVGWDTKLCDGGMIWSPWLEPYKNAITNELFISASVSMYLNFPGDVIDAFIPTENTDGFVSIPHNPAHLKNAIEAYDWLKKSKMIGSSGLYGDGYHIRGWTPENPGTRKCDVFDPMVYTYNQGVILSGQRGLWLTTGEINYLEDGHELVSNVMRATGWPSKSGNKWEGLGRGGVLEEACDHSGTCSQNGHTFKSIFFHHFAEFCRPLNQHEESAVRTTTGSEMHAMRGRKRDMRWHQKKCSAYRDWIEHNAHAAYVTKNEEGKYGMWWGRKYPDTNPNPTETAILPAGATDHRNPDVPITGDLKVDKRDVNDRGRGRTAETQAGALSVFRALYQWETTPSLSG